MSLHTLLISAEVSFKAWTPFARGKSAQYSLDRRMRFPRANSDTVRKTFLPLSRIRLHLFGRKPSQYAKLAWTQDAFFYVSNHEGTMHDCLLAFEEQIWSWCQSKQSDIASSLNFILWASLSRRLNSCFTFRYHMQGPWHNCHYNVRLHQKSYCRIWENLYSTHILIN